MKRKEDDSYFKGSINKEFTEKTWPRRTILLTVLATVLIMLLILYPRLDAGRAVEYHNFVNQPEDLYPEGEVLSLGYRQIAPMQVVPRNLHGYKCYIAQVWGTGELERQCERWRSHSEPSDERKIPAYIPEEDIDEVFYFTSEYGGKDQYLFMVVYGDYGFIYWEAEHWTR